MRPTCRRLQAGNKIHCPMGASLSTATSRASVRPQNLQELVKYASPETVLQTAEIPWIDYPANGASVGVSIKPLRLDRRTGVWAILMKTDGPGKVNRHYHNWSGLGNMSRKAAGAISSVTGSRSPVPSSVSRQVTFIRSSAATPEPSRYS